MTPADSQSIRLAMPWSCPQSLAAPTAMSETGLSHRNGSAATSVRPSSEPRLGGRFRIREAKCFAIRDLILFHVKHNDTEERRECNCAGPNRAWTPSGARASLAPHFTLRGELCVYHHVRSLPFAPFCWLPDSFWRKASSRIRLRVLREPNRRSC